MQKNQKEANKRVKILFDESRGIGFAAKLFFLLFIKDDEFNNYSKIFDFLSINFIFRTAKIHTHKHINPTLNCGITSAIYDRKLTPC